MITEEPIVLLELGGQDVGTMEPTVQKEPYKQRVILPPLTPKYPAFAVQLVFTVEPGGLYELGGH